MPHRAPTEPARPETFWRVGSGDSTDAGAAGLFKPDTRRGKPGPDHWRQPRTAATTPHYGRGRRSEAARARSKPLVLRLAARPHLAVLSCFTTCTDVFRADHHRCRHLKAIILPARSGWGRPTGGHEPAPPWTGAGRSFGVGTKSTASRWSWVLGVRGRGWWAEVASVWLMAPPAPDILEKAASRAVAAWRSSTGMKADGEDKLAEPRGLTETPLFVLRRSACFVGPPPAGHGEFEGIPTVPGPGLARIPRASFLRR